MSEMFRVRVKDVWPGNLVLDVEQVHPDCPDFSEVLRRDRMRAVGLGAWDWNDDGEVVPTGPFGRALGSKDALFGADPVAYFDVMEATVINPPLRDEYVTKLCQCFGVERRSFAGDQANDRLWSELPGRLHLHIEFKTKEHSDGYQRDAAWDL